jgi:plasmid stabilization system protein ParE
VAARADESLLEALAAVAAALGSSDAPSMIIGGIAVIARGKAVAWRDRDRADVERLLVRHGDAIDLARVRAVGREFALALDDPERIDQLEALITRARRADSEF